MVEVRLHGPLAKEFGMKWMLDIKSPAEAIHAIEVNKPGLRKLIRELSKKGLVFRVRSKDHDYDNDDVTTQLGSTKRIDIIPIVRGAGPGVRFVIGAVLVVVGYALSGFTGGASMYLVPVGISLMVGSVVEWMTRAPKKSEDATSDKQSWTLNGPTNLADQGYPVPVIYGEVLTGGYPVSGGLSASQITVGGTLDADVQIVGDLERSNSVGGRNNGHGTLRNTIQLSLSAAAFNLAQPYTFDWDVVQDAPIPESNPVVTLSANGLSNFTISVQLSALNTDGALIGTHSGTVTLTMTGLEQDRSTTSDPLTLTRSITKPWKVTLIDNRVSF